MKPAGLSAVFLDVEGVIRQLNDIRKYAWGGGPEGRHQAEAVRLVNQYRRVLALRLSLNPREESSVTGGTQHESS